MLQKFISLGVRWVLALCLTVSAVHGDASAQTSAGKPTADDVGIQSVLLRLEQDRDALNEFLTGQLSPQMEKVRSTFDTSIAKAGALLDQLTKNPNDPGLRAGYENALSSAIVQASTILEEFDANQDNAFNAIKTLRNTVEDAKKVVGTNVMQHEKEVANLQKQRGSVNDRLGDLARRFQAELDSGRPLPPDVDSDTQLLKSDLEVIEMLEKIELNRMAKAKGSAAVLDQQVRDLDGLRVEMGVLFRQAQGQHVLLTKLAGLKQTELQGEQLAKRIAEFQNGISLRKGNITGVTTLLDQVLKRDLGRNGAAAVTTGKQTAPQPSHDILRGFLPKEKKDETFRAVKK